MVRSAHAPTTTAPATAPTLQGIRPRASAASAPHATTMNSPTSGTYVYRSAIDWVPTCTSPITGSSVPINQYHPVTTNGSFLPTHTAPTLSPSTNTPAIPTHSNGHCPG